MVALEIEQTKVCYKCDEEKPLSEFKINHKKATNVCKSCDTTSLALLTLKRNLRRHLKNAHKKVIYDILEDDPSLYILIAERIGTLEFRKKLMAEKKRAIREYKESSDRWVRFRPNRISKYYDREKLWEQAVKEVLFG